MRREARYRGIVEYFSKAMPVAESELDFTSPYELVVAVMLSAQCTDKRVNLTTPRFFERFPSAEALSQATPEEIYPYIKSISYPNNKAKNLAGMARMLVGEFGGIVPDSVEALERLPGVGRKTANVVASVLFGREVMPVDTHVFRVARRIGLTVGAKTPLQAEAQLEKGFPSHLLPIAHHWLILHGRYVCTARKPKCGECGIREWCKSAPREEREER